jgi:diguanylate cyclase (GGDEF)-like protein
MKIIYKLLLSFLSFVVLIGLVWYLSVNTSQSALRKAIVKDSLGLSATILDKIDRTIYNHIERFKEYTEDLTLREAILESNLEFEKMEDIQAYIDGREQEWTSAPKGEITPFMRELMNKELSEELIEKVGYYAQSYGYRVFGEVFVTGKYGANIAMTGRTTDYRQDDEEWWQRARSEGLYVRDVESDESAGVYSTDIGIRIDDEQGNFAGAMKVVLNIEDVIDILKGSRLEEERKGDYREEFTLLTKDGKVIYSTKEFEFFDDQYKKYAPILGELGELGGLEHKDYLILKEGNPGEGDKLIVHAHSKGYRSFKGLSWFLMIEHETEEIFAPAHQLKKYLTFIFVSMTAFAVLMATFLSRAIARPIKILSKASSEIGRGNLDTKIKVNSNDEVGQLAASFNKMVEDLKETTVSRNLLAIEVEERKRTEDRVTQQSKVLDAINRVFLVRLRCETEEELGKACLSVAEELTGSKFGFIGELNEKGLFDTIAISNPGWDACEMIEDHAVRVVKDMVVRGVDRATMREGGSRIVNGEEAIRNHPDHVELPEGHPKMTSFLGIPFKRNGKVIGMIALGNKEGGYDIADQENMEAASVAIVEALKSKRAERRVEHLAYYDALTDLPNRKLFFDRLNRSILCVKRNEQSLALMYIDLDSFKNINDTLGHLVGDMLLKAVAERLGEGLRKSTTISRLGGDEFAVIVEDISDHLAVINVADRVIDSLKKPLKLSGHEVFVSASIGIAVYPNDGEDVNALLKSADMAMYQAKKQGRNNYQFFSAEMNAELEKKVGIEAKLRSALEKDEFTLHYQPQVELGSGLITGVEALIRWHPGGGELIPPADFIPIAEETSLILEIDRWVLHAACEQMRLWGEAGFVNRRISVNISALHFRRARILETVDTALEETGLKADCLELEITEGVLMEDVEEAVSTLGQLRSRGINIAVDDFGTGYSSLSYLKRFPINRIKIDRSFISGVTTDNDDAAITRTIIAMAQNLNREVIAEGVETKEQLDFLRAEGCNQVQGYYFSKPLPADEFKRLIEK